MAVALRGAEDRNLAGLAAQQKDIEWQSPSGVPEDRNQGRRIEEEDQVLVAVALQGG